MSTPDPDRVRTGIVLYDLLLERRKQHAQWGEQNHPDGTGPDVLLSFGGRTLEDMANAARGACDAATERGRLTWMHIAVEEIFEALAEKDPGQLRHELVQAGAVIMQWIEAIDRREA